MAKNRINMRICVKCRKLTPYQFNFVIWGEKGIGYIFCEEHFPEFLVMSKFVSIDDIYDYMDMNEKDI